MYPRSQASEKSGLISTTCACAAPRFFWGTRRYTSPCYCLCPMAESTPEEMVFHWVASYALKVIVSLIFDPVASEWPRRLEFKATTQRDASEVR